ncbi:hypothetical protein QIS74_03934 [Colletotrichum tabaci]|uniref:Peptidase A1 domain-containing protein n=1 Tax=Colletotrichum tabaci TaxID=1209068 RepID=A0AAV9TNQ8_9PEZI
MLTGDFGDIEYLGGRTAGPVASDIITVGNFSWRQSFLAANESSWSVMPTDGFLGLAFNSFRVGNADTFMHTLLPQLDEPKFGIFLGEDGNNATGLLTLGGSHEDRYSDDEPTKIPIVKGRSNEFDAWRSVIQGVTVKGFKTCGKNVSDTVSFDRGNVVFDTGAGAIQLPSDKIEAAYELMGVNYTAVLWGDRVLSCSEFNSSWSVSFSFSPDDTTETRVVTLRGDELARPGFPAAENACWPPFEDSGSDGFTLLGSPLLKNFYAVWDFGAFDEAAFTPTLGLAKLRK